MREMREILGPSGRLAGAMPGFEYRQSQLQMSEAVAQMLSQEGHLMVEAGTGTGKSLAYLIPSAEWAVRNNKRVIVSTYSKTLQQQILRHDIPMIRERLGMNFRYSLCMGHENYLSLRRLKRAGQTGLFGAPGEEEQMAELFDWAGMTETGLKTDLPFEPYAGLWEDVGRQKDLCMGKRCETYDRCFYFKARRQWFGSHLLIVNHHLFFANIASGGGVLPKYDAVIFDEAQNVEEVATTFLGLEISNTGLFYFLDRIYNPRTKRGALSRISHPVPLHLLRHVGSVRKIAERFFNDLFDEFGRKDRVVRFYKPPPVENTLHAPLSELHEMLKTLEAQIESDEEKLEITHAANRCFEFTNTLTAFLNQQLAGYVYWLTVAERKRGCRATLTGVPINVAEELKTQVYNKTERIALTSATLTTDDGFEFLKKRIGFEPNDEHILDSPFNYETQAMIYLGADLPEPVEEYRVYIPALSRRIEELILAAGGKTFVLFTSYDVMNRVYLQLETRFPDIPLLKQGDLPTGQMIERFKQKPSVILGTSSFWQGVDIPGDALSSVIITKLPFDVPNEPLTEARLETLREQRINPFKHYQIPRAIIQLKQGFGRLIRKNTDVGVVSILDSRMVNRSYGKQFLEALPNCPVTRELNEVRSFLEMNAFETRIRKTGTGE